MDLRETVCEVKETGSGMLFTLGLCYYRVETSGSTAKSLVHTTFSLCVCCQICLDVTFSYFHLDQSTN
jgi:hypothetical protein